MSDEAPTLETWTALHESALAAPLPAVGSIRLTGPDRIPFLHGIVAQDVRAIPEGGFAGSVILDIKGHARYQLTVHRRPDDLHLAVEDGAAGDVLAMLERQRIFDDVTLSDHRDVLRTVTLQGPQARDVVQATFGVALHDATYTTTPFEGAAILMTPSRRSLQGGVDVFVLAKHAPALREALTTAAVPWVDQGGEDLLEASRIEAGVARAGREAGQGVLPQEANLATLLSTTKGCYVGQEIMARLEARAKVKRRLVRLKFAEGVDASIVPGLDIDVEGRNVGRLGGVAHHPTLGWIALAVLHEKVTERVTVAGREATIIGV